MSFNLPGEINPFQAPQAEIGQGAGYPGVVDGDAETIRREHLGRESNLKSLGLLYYLGTFGGILGTILLIALASGAIPMPPNNAPNGLPAASQPIFFGVMAAILVPFTILYGALGYGLSHFLVWARWTTVALTSLGLLGVAIQTVTSMMISPAAGVVNLIVGGGINGFILWLLVSKKANMVFSAEYREIIRRTPHIKQKMSILVKILLGLLLAIIGLIAVAGIASYFGR